MTNDWIGNSNSIYKTLGASNHTDKEHDSEYLRICYYNLKEKYMRGQKDFDYLTWIKLYYFCKNILEKEETNG